MNGIDGLFLSAALLTQFLGADDFRTREAASKGLERLGSFAVPSLNIAAASNDYEVSGRARRLLVAHSLQRLESIEIASLPWLDSIPGGQYETVRLFLSFVNGPLGDTRCDFLGYKTATFYWLHSQIEDGKTWAELQLILEVMRSRCAAWRMNGGHYPAEAELIGFPKINK